MYNGNLIHDIFQITDPMIQNEALPDVARRFDYDFVVVHSFPTEEAFQRYENEENF